MKIFEFQFNPKAKNDRFFRVSSFPAPKEMHDRGDMYMIGELKNALPVNANFLDRLATLLSKEYYDAEKQNLNASHRLKNALKKGNSFLAEETKQGNVDWLGNLHLLLLLFVPSGQGYTLYFTKVGGMKLWLARNGSLVDAGKSVDKKKEDEGSSKVFGNVGSGRIVPQDRIVALTEEMFEFFSKENFLQTITQFKEEKQFKNIFKTKKKEMSLLSGVLLFMLIEALQVSAENGQQTLAKLRLRVPSLATLSKIKLPATPFRIAFPGLSVPLFVKKKLSFVASVSNAKKRMGILILFVFVLFVGFAIFGAEQKNKKEEAQEVLKQKEIEEQERIQNKVIDVTDLQVASEFNESFASENFQHMIQVGGKFYFFSPSSKNISLFDSQAQTFEVMLQSSLADFPADFQLGEMEQFAGNLYFLDSRTGEILKLSERWLDPLSSQKPINAQGMSIDGNIWILGTENEISRYYKGRYQETLHITISPVLRNAISLKTAAQLPYLYILEPKEKRLVVIDKSGILIQQYRNSVFEQARDFVVSSDGQTISLFTGAKLYRISLF